MNLVGLMPCRNEDWILGLSARVALMWCDRLEILLHACSDGSHRIACEVEAQYPDRVVVNALNDSAWDEMLHRQMLLDWARQNVGLGLAVAPALLATLSHHHMLPDAIASRIAGVAVEVVAAADGSSAIA